LYERCYHEILTVEGKGPKRFSELGKGVYKVNRGDYFNVDVLKLVVGCLREPQVAMGSQSFGGLHNFVG